MQFLENISGCQYFLTNKFYMSLFFRNETGCEFLCFDHLIISRFLYIAGGTGAGGKDRRHTLNGSPTVRAHPYTRN